MMKSATLTITLLFVISCSTSSENEIVRVTIEPGNQDLINTPVYVDVDNIQLLGNSVLCAYSDDEIIPAQTEEISASESRIWWNVTKSAAESIPYSIRQEGDCFDQTYNWQSAGENSLMLSLSNQPLLSYEFPVFDPDDIEQTKKPFHHIYAPGREQLITKGPGGLYSHHRGIFFGYNHVYVNDDRLDIWHANDGERSEHNEFLKELEGPVMGGHVVEILWKDYDGNPFLEEEREIRLFKQNEDVVIVDFNSTLLAIDGPVILDGDRQHAGVQFRAAQDVAENAEQTHFIRSGNLSHVPSDTEIEGQDMMDLPWNAMQFVVDGQPYTVAYLSHPMNPENAEMSERRYGRFGEFFRYEVAPGSPLQVHYRFVIKSGDLAPEEIDRHYSIFAERPVPVVQ